jgi:hypothetical protein
MNLKVLEAGEHGKVIKQKGGNKDKQTAAILRRSLRLKDVESGQSDAATMAGMKAFNQARQAGKDADAARTAQATASAEVRRASRAKQLKAKREIQNSHTVYEYIGAILAESLNLFEFKSVRQYKRDLNKTNLSPEEIAKRINLRRKRVKAVATDPNREIKDPVINPPGGDKQGPKHTETGERLGHLRRSAQAARAKAKGKKLPKPSPSKPLSPQERKDFEAHKEDLRRGSGDAERRRLSVGLGASRGLGPKRR